MTGVDLTAHNLRKGIFFLAALHKVVWGTKIEAGMQQVDFFALLRCQGD